MMKAIRTYGLVLALAFFASCNSKPKVEAQTTANTLIERGKQFQLKTLLVTKSKENEKKTPINPHSNPACLFRSC